MDANEFENSEISKPEWFALADADTSIQKKPNDRRLRIMALARPLLLLSVGLSFAQTDHGQDALATEINSVSVLANNSAPVTVSEPSTPEVANERSDHGDAEDEEEDED